MKVKIQCILRNLMFLTIIVMNVSVFSQSKDNRLEKIQMENLRLREKITNKENEYSKFKENIEKELEKYNTRLGRIENIKSYKNMILKIVEQKGIEKISDEELSRYHLIKREEMLQATVDNIGHSFTIFSTFLALVSVFLGGAGFILNNKLKEAKNHLDDFKIAQQETMDFNNYLSKKRKEIEEEAHSYREHFESSKRMIEEIEDGAKVTGEIDKLIEEQNQRILELEKFGVTLSYRDLYDRANAEKMKKNYLEALLLINKSIELEPDYIFSFYLKLEILFELNKVEEIRELVNVLKIKDKEHGKRLGFLANLLSRIGDKAEALSLWDEVFKLEPNLFSAYISRAIFYLNSEEYGKSLEDLNKASEIDPKNENLKYNYACYYSRTNDEIKALEYLKKAVDFDENLKYLALKDPDFENIKNSDSFREITKTD